MCIFSRKIEFISLSFFLKRFVKNLSSNQINLSTLKGEGELSSINLDEKALEELVELPTWLKIQQATCGRVFLKVKIKHSNRINNKKKTISISFRFPGQV